MHRCCSISSLRALPISLAVVLALLLSAVTGHAQANAKQRREATNRANNAAKVFNQIMSVPDRAIPRDLISKAEAILVFPGVVKAAFFVGGQGGQGVVSRRVKNGWTAPAFFKIGGGSFGPQIGAEKTDYVMLIMNEEGLSGLLEDRFEIGGEASISAGPIGRTTSASTNVTLDAGILSYSRSRGAFVGASLKGVVITPDNSLNEAIYEMKARDFLLDARTMSLKLMPSFVRIYPQTLSRYSVRR